MEFLVRVCIILSYQPFFHIKSLVPLLLLGCRLRIVGAIISLMPAYNFGQKKKKQKEKKWRGWFEC